MKFTLKIPFVALIVISLTSFPLMGSSDLGKFLNDNFSENIKADGHFYLFLTYKGCPKCKIEIRDVLRNSTLEKDQLTLILTYDDDVCVPEIYDDLIYENQIGNRFNIIFDDKEKGISQDLCFSGDALYQVFGEKKVIKEEFDNNTFGFLASLLNIEEYNQELINHEAKFIVSWKYRWSLSRIFPNKRSLLFRENVLKRSPEFIWDKVYSDCNGYVENLQGHLRWESIVNEHASCKCINSSLNPYPFRKVYSKLIK